MPLTIDIKHQKKGSGYILISNKEHSENVVIFISKIHTITEFGNCLNITAGEHAISVEMPESDRKAIFEFILKEQRHNENISKEAIKANEKNQEATNSRLQSIQELLSAQDKQITANQILLDSMLKTLTQPTPKKSQTASILKHAGFA
jgi:HSP90 family molecular chaperone